MRKIYYNGYKTYWDKHDWWVGIFWKTIETGGPVDYTGKWVDMISLSVYIILLPCRVNKLLFSWAK